MNNIACSIFAGSSLVAMAVTAGSPNSDAKLVCFVAFLLFLFSCLSFILLNIIRWVRKNPIKRSSNDK